MGDGHVKTGGFVLQKKQLLLEKESAQCRIKELFTELAKMKVPLIQQIYSVDKMYVFKVCIYCIFRLK